MMSAALCTSDRVAPQVKMRNCCFQSNTAVGDGGAIRLLSNADMVGCSFAGNQAGRKRRRHRGLPTGYDVE